MGIPPRSRFDEDEWLEAKCGSVKNSFEEERVNYLESLDKSEQRSGINRSAVLQCVLRTV